MLYVPDHFYVLSHVTDNGVAELGLHLDILAIKECLKVISHDCLLLNTVKCRQAKQ